MGEWGGINLFWYANNNAYGRVDLHGLKEVYLQFDDSPIGGTSVVLDALRETQVKATFFIVGKHIEDIGKSGLLSIVADGHTIGNHSYSHWYLKRDLDGKTTEDWVSDFVMGEDEIHRIVGQRPKYARIPGNKPEWRKEIAAALAAEGWKVLGWDWEIGGSGKGNGNPREPERNCSIIDDNGYKDILLHPQNHRYSGAKEDLVCFVECLKKRGFAFRSLKKAERSDALEE